MDPGALFGLLNPLSEKISAVKYSKLGLITTIDMGEIIRNNLLLSLTINVVDRHRFDVDPDPAGSGSACLGCRSGSRSGPGSGSTIIFIENL